MPYLADGSFTPDMPATNANPLASVPGADAGAEAPLAMINKHTGYPYRVPGASAASNPLAKLPKPAAAPKPGYANTNVPMFPDYVKFAAARDKTDLGTADDATLLGYAKEYAEQMLPQALLGAGHKVDKEYLKTLTPNFQYQTAQQLPALRAYFASQAPATPAVDPAATPEWKDYLKMAAGKALEGTGNAAGGLVRQLGSPRSLADMALAGIGLPAKLGMVAAEKTLGQQLPGGIPSIGEAAVPASVEKAAAGVAGPAATAVTNALAGTGRNVEASETPQFKAKAEEPLLTEGQHFFNEDGSLNPKVFNAKALNAPSLTSKTLGTAAEFAAPLLATYLTKSPAPLIALGGTQASEQMYNEEKKRINGLSPEELDKLPAYHALTLNGMDPGEAKKQIAEQSATLQGKFGLLTGAATGATADIPFFKPVAASLLKRVASNYLQQAPLFAALAAGQTAGGTALRNAATGEKGDVLKGTGEAALGAALGAAPFALGAHGAPEAAPRGAEPVPGEATSPAPAGAASGDAVSSSISQAFMEHPVPPAAALADPVQAQAHYAQALAAFKGDLRGADVALEAVAAAQPAFDKAWQEQTGQPLPSATAPGPTPEEPLSASPAELDAAASAAPEPPPVPDATESIDLSEPTPAAAETPATGPEARAGAAPEELPLEVRTHVEEQLRASLGREPTPEEVAKAGAQLLDVVLSDPRIDARLPRNALEKAVGELAGKELPKPAEVNALAKKLASEPLVEAPTERPPENPLAKKAEAAPKEEDAALLRAQEEKFGERVATPEERAKYEPLENFYRRYGNVRDALEAMSTRLKDEKLAGVAKRILANPYLRERLGQEKLSIRNPEDAPASPIHEDIGSYLRKVRTKDGSVEPRVVSTWGAYHPKQGVILAGSGWAARTGIDNGLHPVTFVHEAMHAAISHVIRGVEKGEIKDAGVVKAHSELEGIRKALERYAEATSTDKDTVSALKYAATNVHELTSVAMTDPRVQSALSRIKIGTINAWQKLMGIFTRLLGAAPEEQSTIERVAHLTNQLIDYRPEGASSGDEAHLSQRSERIEENTADRVQEAIRVKAPKERLEEERAATVERQQPTTAQSLETKIFDKLKPLTHVIERLRGEGKEVSPKEDIDAAVRVYQNLASRAANVSQQRFVQPAVEQIAALAAKAGKPADEFLSHLSAFYFGKRALEVNERGELESARLRSSAEKQRDALKQEWAAGKLQNGAYIEALKGVVNAPGARVANRSPLYKAGITDEVAHELISRARRQGITPDVIASFEPTRKSLVDEVNRNYADSGRFSAADAARRSGLGSKWYLPLKGLGEASDAADFEGSGIGAFTREYQAAGGRASVAANPILNLLQEVQRSSRDVPENTMTKSVYNFAKKFGNDLGIKVRTFDVESAVKDAVAGGKGLDEMARAFKNENSIVHNNGEYRYSIEFPKDSPVLEALKGVNETPELNAFQRVAGRVTNLIARGATTLNPKFLLWNAFWRDTGYVGAQIGMDHGPQAMLEYATRYWMNGGPLRGRPTYFSGLRPRNALEREAYAATGKSQFAKSLSEIAARGGDLSFENELNAAKNMDNVYTALEKASKPGTSVAERTHAVVKFLDQIGTSDIMTARVAAYETYKSIGERKLGKDATPEQLEQVKKDAALYSRRVLDYQQRSDLSRSLNVVFPFSRVVLNQTDRLLQTFKKRDGSYDVKRVAAMTAVGLMAGATYYALLRQAHPDVKKQENSTLAQNWVVPINGSLVRVPMAYGLTRLFLVPGMMAARAAFGDSSNEDATNEVRNALVEGFLPFKPPEAQHNERFHDEVMDMVTAMTPGALRPVMELERNKNVFGTGITPKDEFTKGPHSQAGFRSTPEAWKWASKTLHSLTGGALDVYPESLEYLTSAYGTGLGNAFIRAAAMQDRSAKGTETDAQQLPFVPSVTSRDAEFYESRKLQELREDLEAKGDAATPKEKEELKELRGSAARFGRERSSIAKNPLLSPAVKQKQLDAVSVRQKAEQKQTLGRLEHAQ